MVISFPPPRCGTYRGGTPRRDIAPLPPARPAINVDALLSPPNEFQIIRANYEMGCGNRLARPRGSGCFTEPVPTDYTLRGWSQASLPAVARGGSGMYRRSSSNILCATTTIFCNHQSLWPACAWEGCSPLCFSSPRRTLFPHCLKVSFESCAETLLRLISKWLAPGAFCGETSREGAAARWGPARRVTGFNPH
ncbi:jg27129 [Pararge aegeria aegeria]|uniref:Jg27129 protein n=1 Tax=Pararge aegeria aegeria TaxID=348720 RepID=A0A8S4QWF1_9NEOP|nr:jg27129 [Pararge aegeria aegeria]